MCQSRNIAFLDPKPLQKKGMNWYEALEYITSKNSEKFAGHDNWRLPTLNELNNLWQSSGKVKSKA